MFCSSRGPRFNSQHLYSRLQLSVTSVQGIWCSPLVSTWALCTCMVHRLAYRSNTNTQNTVTTATIIVTIILKWVGAWRDSPVVRNVCCSYNDKYLLFSTHMIANNCLHFWLLEIQHTLHVSVVTLTYQPPHITYYFKYCKSFLTFYIR